MSGTIQPPSQWATGDDPITNKQAAFLTKLADEKGVDVDTDHTNKGRASELIDELKSKPATSTSSESAAQPKEKAGAGRADPSDAVKDTSEWTTGADGATQKQKAYLAVLEKRAGEGVHGLSDLSKAEASERIEELKTKTGE